MAFTCNQRKISHAASQPFSEKKVLLWRNIAMVAGFLLLVYFIGTFLMRNDYSEISIIGKRVPSFVEKSFSVATLTSHSEITKRFFADSNGEGVSEFFQEKDVKIKECNTKRNELPKGVIHATADLERLPLWGSIPNKSQKSSKNLLAIAVGLKQKTNVDKIVQKFPAENFTVMLFHYDGLVNEWYDLKWSREAIHIVAMNQTKWWFAKRFLHPDITASYDHIFLWDEDLGVENFDADRYLNIMKEEGLQITQPALEPSLSEVHHPITMRIRGSKVHRRLIKSRGTVRCTRNSTAPPCTGWVEMMAPVISKAAWHCTWKMIQNDLVHGWGLDMKLGYCAQGNRTEKIGIIDQEYIIHLGIQSLGEKNSSEPQNENSARVEIRRQSYLEMNIFKQRWEKAIKEDQCWVDPYA